MRTILLSAIILIMPLVVEATSADVAHRDFSGMLDRFAPATEKLSYLTGSKDRIGNSGKQARLDELMTAYWEWKMRTNPEAATYTGFPGQNDRWSEYTDVQEQKIQALQRKTLETLEGIDPDDLPDNEKLNYVLLRDELALAADGHAYPEHWLLVNQMYGVHTGIARVLSAMPLFDADDVEDYITRLRGIPALLRQVETQLAQGLEHGITPPRHTLGKVVDQVQGLLADEPMNSPLLRPLRNLPTTLEGRALTQALAEKIYRQDLAPAINGFAEFLNQRYVRESVATIGLSALPQGEAWYAWRVRSYTSTDLSPTQIHALGIDEVDRIRAEMLSIMQDMGYAGTDVAGFVKQLYSDSSQFYTDPADMLRDYRALAKQADGQLPKLFRRFPSLPYAVDPIPAHEAAGSSAAYYRPGSAENGRPGIFAVNTARLTESPKFEMQALMLHEGVPGHHFQLALAQEQTGLPSFRRHGRVTAFIEGWGLYAESLGPELGFYQTPIDRFGALTFEMWRAVRLVVDTGMHALGWTRQQAIDYFIEHTGRGLTRIAAEVDRYLVMPGQALAYKVGQLRILELKTRAQQRLGPDFDIRAFHDEVLREGALPLSVLEQRIERWLIQQETQNEK